MKTLRCLIVAMCVLLLIMSGCAKPKKISVQPKIVAEPASEIPVLAKEEPTPTKEEPAPAKEQPKPPKRVFLFESMIPAHVQSESALQESIDYPPLLRPEGKRNTIHPASQYFTIGVLNAIDISGRSQDISKTVADMLYTELFLKNRFNLLDRGELIDLNPEWFVTSIRESLQLSNSRENMIEDRAFNASQSNIIDSTVKYLEMQGNTYERIYTGLLDKVDGILLIYITSRIGDQEGGSFGVDYRLVNQIQGATHQAKEAVLFAGTSVVRYQRSSRKEIQINREDIKDIALNIVNAFPKPQDSLNYQVVKRDQRWIAINGGKNQGIIPGLFGYVAIREDSIYIEDGENKKNSRHFAYLAKFLITEVYEKTCTALLLYPSGFNSSTNINDYEWDVRVGDGAMIK